MTITLSLRHNSQTRAQQRSRSVYYIRVILLWAFGKNLTSLFFLFSPLVVTASLTRYLLRKTYRNVTSFLSRESRDSAGLPYQIFIFFFPFYIFSMIISDRASDKGGGNRWRRIAGRGSRGFLWIPVNWWDFEARNQRKRSGRGERIVSFKRASVQRMRQNIGLLWGHEESQFSLLFLLFPLAFRVIPVDNNGSYEIFSIE